MGLIRKFGGAGAGTLLVLSLYATPVQAERLFLDGHGLSPDRVVFIVQDFAFDSTPVSIEPSPTLLKTIEVTMVYEGKAAPFVSVMDLEIKCPNPTAGVSLKKALRDYERRGGGPPPPPALLPDPETVEFRMVRGSQYLKNAVGYKAMQPSDWQTADSYAMKRIYRVACNDALIAHAKAKTPIVKGETTDQNKTGEYLDMVALRKNLEAIDLQYAEYMPSGVFGIYLADLVWEKLWTDAQPPQIDYGPPLTPEQQVALKEKLASFRQQLDAQRVELESSLKSQKAQMDFTAAAAKFRGGRQWARGEAMINRMWLSKTDREVVASLGAPQVAEAGGVRYLSYGHSYDNQAVFQNVVTGAIRVNGVFRSCNVQFAMIADSSGEYRVADVIIKADSNINGADVKSTLATNCSEILDRPM